MKIQRWIVNSLFTHQCLWCKLSITAEKTLCNACDLALPFYRDTPLLPALDDIQVLFRYEPPISHWITQFKFNGNLSFIRFFTQHWIKKIAALPRLPTRILPVPLHPKRLKMRGFNQALEIAKPIGKFFNIPIDTQSCIKIKGTSAQSELTRAMRVKNLKNAFALTRDLAGEHVVILDDVLTTGTTLSTIAELLRFSGVSKVSAWCCAKVVLTNA